MQEDSQLYCTRFNSH